MSTREIKSAIEFIHANGIKGRVETFFSPEDLEKEIKNGYKNDGLAAVPTPEGVTLFNVKGIVVCQIKEAHNSDIKIIRPDQVNVPADKPPLKVQ